MDTMTLPYMSIDEWNIFIQTATYTEIYDEWKQVPADHSVRYFLRLENTRRVDMLLQMLTADQESLILHMANKNIAELLDDIAPDDLVDLFQKISIEVRESVWENLSPEKKEVANFLLRFDYDDAAGIMTPHYVKVKPTISVAQTIKFIRKNVDVVETIYYIYIVDAINRLQGVVSLRDLFRNQDDVKLSEFMQTKIQSVSADTDQEEVVELLQEYDLIAIPVIDKFNQLLGIVTIDDAMQILSEEHSEDVLKMGAISADKKNHPQSYLESSILTLFKSRAPWLAILLLAGTLTSNVIHLFSPLLSYAPYIVLFIPVITSTGGNTATQSATLMIHGLASNSIAFKNILRVLAKETLVAIMIGIFLAIVMIIRSLLFPPALEIIAVMIISLSLLFVVFFSALIGTIAPLLISKIGADPTVIATPLIATIIDLVGLSIYFSMTYFLYTL